MDGNQFAEHLLKMKQQTEQFINDDAPEIMGKTAVDFFTQSFQNEGFTNNGLNPWPEVERRKGESEWYGFSATNKGGFSEAASSRNILTGESDDLGRSIQQKNAANGEVTIYSDLKYADVHNSGGTAYIFGKKAFTMPKRQFIGHSAELDKEVTDELKRKLDIIIK